MRETIEHGSGENGNGSQEVLPQQQRDNGGSPASGNVSSKKKADVFSPEPPETHPSSFRREFKEEERF